MSLYSAWVPGDAINGVSSAFGGASYRSAIQALVTRLHAHGLAAVLDLHWAAPGRGAVGATSAAPVTASTPRR